MEADTQINQRRALRDLLDWLRSIDTSDWQKPYAITLNFWPGTSRQTAEACVREFLNRLSRKVFGNANRRHGKRLRVIPVLEGVGQVHCHLLIESAEHISGDEFTLICKQLWSNIQSAQTYIRCSNGGVVSVFDAQPIYSGGWLNYIAKTQTKLSADDVSILNMVV